MWFFFLKHTFSESEPSFVVFCLLLNDITELGFLSLFFFIILQAIFELSQGEQDLIEDLKLAKKVSSAIPISGLFLLT